MAHIRPLNPAIIAAHAEKLRKARAGKPDTHPKSLTGTGRCTLGPEARARKIARLQAVTNGPSRPSSEKYMTAADVQQLEQVLAEADQLIAEERSNRFLAGKPVNAARGTTPKPASPVSAPAATKKQPSQTFQRIVSDRKIMLHSEWSKLDARGKAQFFRDGGRLTRDAKEATRDATAYAPLSISRAEFNQLTPRERSTFCREGGRITN